MVRIKLPCISLEAHGQIYPGLIFATNTWGQYLKFSPTRRDPKTEAQQKVRHAYGQVSSLWRALSNEEKASYHKKAVKNRRTDANQHFHEKWPEVYEP